MADLMVLPDIPLALNPKRRARYTEQDILNIATLVSQKHLSETQACLRLGIKPEAFFIWKSRAKHSERFGKVIEHAKAIHLEKCIDRIDASAQGVDMKQPDWRAAAWRAERLNPALQTQQNQGQSQQQPVISVTVITALGDAYDKAIAQLKAQAEPRQIGPVVEVGTPQEQDTNTAKI